MNDIDNVSNTLQNNLTQILSSLVMLISVMGMMFYVSWRMTLIAISVLPACLVVTFVISRYSRRYFRRQWDHMGELNGHIEEMYTGHNIVKVFGHEQNAIAEFDEINDELYRVSRKAQFISGTAAASTFSKQPFATAASIAPPYAGPSSTAGHRSRNTST